MASPRLLVSKLELEFFMSGKFASWSDVSPRDATLKRYFWWLWHPVSVEAKFMRLQEMELEMFGVAQGKFIDVKAGFLNKTQIRTSGRGQAQPVLSALENEDGSLQPLCPSTAVDEYLRLPDK